MPILVNSGAAWVAHGDMAGNGSSGFLLAPSCQSHLKASQQEGGKKPSHSYKLVVSGFANELKSPRPGINSKQVQGVVPASPSAFHDWPHSFLPLLCKATRH